VESRNRALDACVTQIVLDRGIGGARGRIELAFDLLTLDFQFECLHGYLGLWGIERCGVGETGLEPVASSV